MTQTVSAGAAGRAPKRKRCAGGGNDIAANRRETRGMSDSSRGQHVPGATVDWDPPVAATSLDGDPFDRIVVTADSTVTTLRDRVPAERLIAPSSPRRCGAAPPQPGIPSVHYRRRRPGLRFRRHDRRGGDGWQQYLAVGLAVVALLALPAVAGAAETPGRPVAAVQSTQTCSRPSTCETDAAARAQALTPRRVGGRGIATAAALLWPLRTPPATLLTAWMLGSAPGRGSALR
jgi:hypothetical protein